jgi:GDP-L-fucose synthase
MFEGKKVLVAGGTGFVGVNMIGRLLSQGAVVRATVHETEPEVCHDGVEYVKCDLLKKEDCRKSIQGMEYVFHCAGNTSGAAGLDNAPMSFLGPNVSMNMNVLEASFDADVRKILMISSTTMYPDSGSKPLVEQEAFDGDPYDKYFAVGWMNRFTEVLCRVYSEKIEKRMTAVVLRPTNIYGEHDNFEIATSHVLPALVRKVVERRSPIEVWGSGNDIRDFLYVDDFVDAAMLAMDRIDSYSPINIGQGRGYSVRQILEMMLDIDRYGGAEIQYDSSQPSMIPVRLVDVAKSERILGFRAKTDLREGIRRTIRWYRREYLRKGPSSIPLNVK